MADASTADFLSGTSGQVSGIRATTKAIARDALADGLELATVRRLRLARAASRMPRRRVLALGVKRDDAPNLLAEAVTELRRSRHIVTVATTNVGGLGKFENINRLLEHNPAAEHDWLLLLDDDVDLPHGFLDAFLFLAERFELRMAQPAHRSRSHAAWAITRRQLGCVVRETAFVEIGPVVALHASTFQTLLPFPELQFGWGLDVHWSAIARAHSWRIGVVDATAIRHGMRLIASSYDRGDAIAEARRFLLDRPYVNRTEALRTVAVHRRWR